MQSRGGTQAATTKHPTRFGTHTHTPSTNPPDFLPTHVEPRTTMQPLNEHATFPATTPHQFSADHAKRHEYVHTYVRQVLHPFFIAVAVAVAVAGSSARICSVCAWRWRGVFEQPSFSLVLNDELLCVLDDGSGHRVATFRVAWLVVCECVCRARASSLGSTKHRTVTDTHKNACGHILLVV